MAGTNIDLAALGPLQGPILTLRIIVASLALGVILFAGYAIVQNLGKPFVLAAKFEPLNLIMLAFAVLDVPIGIVVAWLLFRHFPTPPEVLAKFAGHGPEVAQILAIQSRIQTAVIVGCALFEGAAFGNLFAYMTSAEWLHLIAAGVLLMGIFAWFPLPGRCERWIETELRRQQDEAARTAVGIDLPGRV